MDLAWVFWIGVIGVLYPYLLYPLLLAAWAKLRREPARPEPDQWPSLSIIIPVHNEVSRLGRKIENTLSLDYPAGLVEVLFISDGSTDDTVPLIRSHLRPGWSLQELSVRSGKAAALNAGLHAATGDLLVFTDAAIELRPDALRRIVQPFTDPVVGCVSGEDRIADAGGEGLYGRYELLLRRLESRVHSIVGASGSFYAQRRSICRPFTEGMAPDFLSVLRTVAQGYRALSEERAVGSMTSLKDPRQEFDRKVRTLIRGMTTLFAHPELLNPFRYGAFAFALWSHKVMRWLAPFFMLIAFAASLALLDRPLYLAAAIAQAILYGVALLAWYEIAGVGATLPGRIALYFVNVNAAVVAAWFRYVRGVRQEIWTPSRRA
jgi:cellulose synthase/poly-beta-1,6-N-acetylglucosamine synthase-like glycosyltransferase